MDTKITGQNLDPCVCTYHYFLLSVYFGKQSAIINNPLYTNDFIVLFFDGFAVWLFELSYHAIRQHIKMKIEKMKVKKPSLDTVSSKEKLFYFIIIFLHLSSDYILLGSFMFWKILIHPVLPKPFPFNGITIYWKPSVDI